MLKEPRKSDHPHPSPEITAIWTRNLEKFQEQLKLDAKDYVEEQRLMKLETQKLANETFLS